MDSILFKINLKTQYDFYYYLASFTQREEDWKTFYEILLNLPDCVEELEELKKETKRRLDNEQNTEEYVEKISGFVLDMSVLTPPVLVKIVYYMSNHFFSYYIPRYIKPSEDSNVQFESSDGRISQTICNDTPLGCPISNLRRYKDLSSYNYIVEEIRLIKYRIQLFIFLKFVKELLQEVNDENSVLNSILSATDLCLMEMKHLSTPSSSQEPIYASHKDSNVLQNKIFLEKAFTQYIETIIPIFTDLKQNHSQEYDKINNFFDIKMN